MNESVNIADWQHRIAVANDQEAFLRLYRFYKVKLEKFALSICHSKEDAEEIVEDVFVRLWTKSKTIDQIQNLKLYLYIATRNFSLNYCRTKQRNAHLQLDDLKIDVEDILQDPYQKMVSSEGIKAINEAVQALPPKCKIIFKLVKEDGLKQKEVAEILHISVKTVENQLAIAVRKLAMSLATYTQQAVVPREI
jgi:RNA polymerase sigma-70 factor (family 1)